METCKILTGKVDVEPELWFTPLTSSTRTTSGHLNLARRDANHEPRKNQFSIRVVSRWNQLPDLIKSKDTLNKFKNACDNYQQKELTSF